MPGFLALALSVVSGVAAPPPTSPYKVVYGGPTGVVSRENRRSAVHIGDASVRYGVTQQILAPGEILSRANQEIGIESSVRLLIQVSLGSGRPLFLNDFFSLELRGGTKLSSQDFKPTARPQWRRLQASKALLRESDHANGWAWEQTLVEAKTGLRADFRVEMRDYANWAKTGLTLTPTKGPVDVARLVMLNGTLKNAKVMGTVAGSPVVGNGIFVGLEHPMSESTVKGNHFECAIRRKLPLQPGQKTTYSAVIGTYQPGQLRRGFLRYVEGERARPYEPFLHYNSWYDIGYFTKYTAKECISVIQQYGQKLVRLRGAKMSSFLFDDGWDDTSTVWNFNSDFPKGFRPVSDTASYFGASAGAWLSPWGGYGPPRDQRLATGRKLGYEVDGAGYALSGPRYYERFHEVAMDLVKNHGINQFKLDGTGSPDKQYPGSKFGSDFDAAISLIGDLRKAKPSLFVNLTTGTWPSPFWTQTADSIWRGGTDHSFSGVGTKRQQWMTYRDADTYHGIVQQGPLYPLNSLMLHGIIYAKHAHDLNTDPGDDFRRECMAYFGSGTQLQEMYVSPELLKDDDWDALAEGARWTRANKDTLVDTHWVGGDPAKLEVYGHAAWNGGKAILVLRNPSDKLQAFGLEPRRVFELPPSLKGEFKMHDMYLDVREDDVEMDVSGSKVIKLRPFQVLILIGEIR